MGGHTIYPGGIALDMRPFRSMELMEDGETLLVGSGATWAEVLPYLNERGRSVAVMQSNNDFTVGGSVSVNCHGWQMGKPPIASSVRRFRLLKPNGELVTCSRELNSDLFALALGGYGLFGVILDVELTTVPSECYLLNTYIVDSMSFHDQFEKYLVEHSGHGMFYGRLSVDRNRFLTEASLNFLVRTNDVPENPIPKSSKTKNFFKRVVFRSGVGRNWGKKWRWDLEKAFGQNSSRRPLSRNTILNESSDLYEEHSRNRVNTLHEYFVPREQFAAFITSAQKIIPDHDIDLMNVTVRDVRMDSDTFLRYADQDMFALVMLFNHETSDEADAVLEALTGELIDAALALGGRYYLPYRRHASVEQFLRSYPMADEFFAAKLRHDPEQVFQNKFYTTYGNP